MIGVHEQREPAGNVKKHIVRKCCITILWHSIMIDSKVKHLLDMTKMTYCCDRLNNMKQNFQFHQNHITILFNFLPPWCSSLWLMHPLLLLSPNCWILLFVAGGQDNVESDPDNPTYKVSSELTLEVSRSDDNSFITCAVDHATLTSGNKKSVQALRVLCESNGEGVGPGEEVGKK